MKHHDDDDQLHSCVYGTYIFQVLYFSHHSLCIAAALLQLS